jgi:genome maintenance exonuclease 1
MFNHVNHLGDVDLKSREIDGTRFYTTPSGDSFPSITSVTSHKNKEFFAEWRERVGEEEANKICKLATTRGTKFHEVCQDYLENNLKESYDEQSMIMFDAAKPYLDKIGLVHAIERSMFSEVLGIAGRVDCIAEYDGELAVIDFKTSSKIKKEEWIEQYFVQEVAYACMYFELTGIPVKKLITIMVTPAGVVKVFDKRDKMYYIKLLTGYIKEFVSDKLKTYGK